MTIDNNIGRVSNLGNVQEPQGENKVQEQQQRGAPEPTFGQKFGKQMKEDMSFIPTMLTGHFQHVSNLVESHGRAKEMLESKPQRLEEIKGRRKELDTLVEEKRSEIATTMRNLIKTGSAFLDEKSTKAMWKWIEQKLDDPKHLDTNTLRQLKGFAPDIGKALDTKLGEFTSLTNESKNLQDEKRMLDKLTPGKLAGKAIRAGLAGIGCSLLTAFKSVFVAPLMPLWTLTALVRSTGYAATGHVLGSPNAQIRNDLNETIDKIF
jgi:hypothetical protein